MKSRSQLLAWLLFAVSFAAPPATATEVPVMNWSFEEDLNNGQALSPGEYVYSATGWHESNPGGADNFTENVAGFTYMGSNHQGMTSGSSLWQYLFRPYDPANPQDLESRRWRLEPGVKYSLIVAIGHRPGWTQPGNNTVFKLQLVDGGVAVPGGLVVGGTVTDLVVGSIDASTLPAGTFRNFNITYDAGASVPSGSLRIQLQCAGSDRAHFDNVHLMAVKPTDLSGGIRGDHPQNPSTPQDAVPAWESRPGTPWVVYLDFDGEAVIGPMPEWNMGRPLVNVPPAGLNVSEMRRAFEIVKEDFLPFNLNITTDRTRYDAAPPGRRMRCVITTADRWMYEESNFPSTIIGGIAHTSSFPLAGRSKDPAVPCFVFVSDWIGANQKQSGASLAQDISHEVGHTLGVGHDGVLPTPAKPQGEVYFNGHGTGPGSTTIPGVVSWQPNLWGPIMGHGQLISQWNDGTYGNANNPENDIEIIASSFNEFGYATDDNTAADLANAVLISTVNDSFTKDSFIGLTASGAEDEDWWKIVLQADGVLDLKLNPYEPFTSGDANTRMELNLGIPNLVARVDLYRQNGSSLTGASPTLDFSLPPNATPAQRLRLMDAPRVKVIQHLSAGTYYLRITGAGFGNPQTDGATSYGSMGAYSLDGTIRHHPVIANADRYHVVETGTFFSKQLFAQGGPVTWSASGLPPGLRIAGDNGSVNGVPLVPGTYIAQFVATGPGGQGTANVTFYVNHSAALANAVDLAIPVTWQFDTLAGWFTQTGTSSDGVDAAQASPVSAGQSAYMETTLTGPGYLTFRWKFSAHPALAFLAVSRNGIEQRRLSTDDGWHVETVELLSGVNTLRWTFGKQPGAVPSGADSAWVDDMLLELDVDTLGHSLDSPGLFVGRDGTGYWVRISGQFNAAYGSNAVRSPVLNHGQFSDIYTDVTGPGTFTFKWASDCEPVNDYVAWFVGNTEQARLSGPLAPFASQSVTLAAGTHRIRWRYLKNGSVSTGADAAWIDRVQWSPSQPPPVITNPLDITWTVGAIVSYPITATNSPTGYNLTGTLPQGLFFLSADHLIAGIPARAGSSPVTLFATNAAGTGQQEFTINIESAYTKWARDNGLTGANAALTADPDRDGRSNLLEMALNLNPNVREPAFAGVAVNPSTRRLTATFSRVTAYQDIMYEVQVTDNLSTWTTIASSINGQPMTSLGAFSVNDPGGSVSTVTVVDNAAWPTKTKRSMRIKITQL